VRRAREQAGTTLIELLVSMALAMIVLGATLTVFEVFQRQNRTDILRNEAQDTARSAIDRLAREIRNVAAPKGEVELPGALEQAEEYSLVFQTIDAQPKPEGSLNASNAMRVRYCLSNTVPTNEKLWRQVKRWTTVKAPEAPAPTSECPDNVAGHWDSSAQLAFNISNRDSAQKRPAFVYGPSGWKSIAEIVTVEPNLYINVNPGNRPGETQLTSAISLRNANRSPIAAFTAKEFGSKHALLNASESLDPDGLALTYEWKETGKAAVVATAQQWQTGGLSTGVHSYTLVVTDPGGLKAEKTETVTIN
jgi:type II secretory pathway component PulJ